jgi:hypothetical protein
MRILVVIVGALVFLASVSRAGDMGFAQEATQLVDDLISRADLKGRKIAVGGFSDADGKMTGLSGLFAEDMELALVKRASRGEFQVMDRRNVGELTREWELSVNGAVDDDHLVRAGKLLGAQVLCIGKYTRSGKKLLLRASLVGSEKGEILAAGAAEIKLTSEQRDLAEKALPPPAPPAPPAPAPGAKEPLKVELTTDKAQYAVGDKMTISVKVSQDCYLTIIDVGPSNKATVLFPNLYAPSNAVKAGSTFRIPDASAGFELEISPPAGVEIIRAIASREPAIDLADLKPTAEAPFTELKKELSVVTRDIHVKAKKAKPGEWSESVVQLNIR